MTLQFLHVFAVPSAPVNVSVRQADPHRFKVLWEAPLTPNGPVNQIKYKIIWEKRQGTTISTGNVVVLPNNTRGSINSGHFNYFIGNLLANNTYTIQVILVVLNLKITCIAHGMFILKHLQKKSYSVT